MAKNAITDYSQTNSANADVGGISIMGSAPVSNMDNGLRQVMVHLADANKGASPVLDTWTFADPADLTKRARLDAGGVTTGQTRVLAAPDSDGTIAILRTTQILTKTANYTAVAADRGALIRFTSAATLALTAAATLGASWCIDVAAVGVDIIIDPNASELIDGAATLTLTSGSSARIYCDGTSFTTLRLAPPQASETVPGIIEIATAAEYRNPASNVLALTPGRVKDAMAEVSLTDAATIAWDMSAGFDFTVTLTANRTLGNPTNTTVGKRGRIRVVQDGTGGWTLTKSSNHKTPGGAALSIASAAGAETFIYYDCVSSTKILLSNSPFAWS